MCLINLEHIILKRRDNINFLKPNSIIFFIKISLSALLCAFLLLLINHIYKPISISRHLNSNTPFQHFLYKIISLVKNHSPIAHTPVLSSLTSSSFSCSPSHPNTSLFFVLVLGHSWPQSYFPIKYPIFVLLSFPHLSFSLCTNFQNPLTWLSWLLEEQASKYWSIIFLNEFLYYIILWKFPNWDIQDIYFRLCQKISRNQ